MADSPLGLTGLLDELLAEREQSDAGANSQNQDSYNIVGADVKPPKMTAVPRNTIVDVNAQSPKQAAASTALICGEMEALLAKLEANRCKDMEDVDLAPAQPENSDSEWTAMVNASAGLAPKDEPPPAAVPAELLPQKPTQAGQSGVRTLTLDVGPVPRPWHAAADDGQLAAFVSHAQDANDTFRNYMEDGETVADPMPCAGRLGADATWSMFAVYDGHGGREAVNYCESTLLQLIASEMENVPPGKDVNSALTSAFSKVDSQLAMCGAWSYGCTCTVCLVHRDNRCNRMTLHVANVGDSRAVLVGENGSLRVSVDHRPDNPDETRRVVAEGGRVRAGRVGGKLAISRSLGDHHLKSVGVSGVPDITVCGVARGHILIIASDGLWDVLKDEEATEIVEAVVKEAEAGNEDVKEWLRANASQRLVDRAKQLGSRDNILAQVVFF
eukprot:TRINITY_DN102852_c0_g1_i1.p1 TRINITY_DN102852_c0_g1~~TRINITY_DN102852_c0_g1_i1.p1  ORF type:complete len:443 (-),score=113.96 TRINITY_DN102852_c0_g1_i1:161-1489(-)